MITEISEKQAMLTKKVGLTQALVYPCVVIIIGVSYILLNIQFTAEQLRFALITYAWETIISTALTVLFVIRWVRPIEKYIQHLELGQKIDTAELNTAYSLAIRYPLQVGIMSTLVVFTSFVIGIIQMIVFYNINSVLVLQGFSIGILAAFGTGITSVLVYERLMASNMAKLCEVQPTRRIILPMQTKLIIVSLYLVLLCFVFMFSSQLKNFTINYNNFSAQRGLYELHLLRASVPVEYIEKYEHKKIRESLMDAVEIAPSRMLCSVDLATSRILPLTNNLDVSTVRNIISRHRKKMRASKEGFIIDVVSKKYITFIEGTVLNEKFVMIEPQQWIFTGFSPFASATLGTMIVVCAFAAILSFILAGNIRRPVHSLSKLAEKVTTGKLSSSLKYTSTDELGWLSSSMHRMVETLAESIKRLRIMTGQLGIATSEIASAVDENEKISHQQVQELSTTLETLDKLRQSSLQVFEESRHVRELVENATQTIILLSEKTGEVGQMSATITEISEQINMLSLNASIEAARAGEQGKGFAVVAEEIRELADSTNQFTIGISKLIDDIQSSVRNTILSTEKMVSGVRHISLSVEQQSEGTRQIVDSIEQMNQGFRQSAISGQEVGVSISSLKDMADEIRQFIEKYDLNGQNEKSVLDISGDSYTEKE